MSVSAAKQLFQRILAIGIVAVTSSVWAQTPQPGPGRPPRFGADPNFWAGKKRLLAVADVETGFHHDSISHALATIERLGRDSGAYMTMIRTDPQLITKI